MTVTPANNAPHTPQPQLNQPAQAPAKNDHDADDAGGAVKASVEKGVGEALDTTA